MRRAWAAILVAVGVTGCDIEFVQTRVGASFALTVLATDSATPEVRVRGIFDPGVDERDRPNVVPNDVVVVLGEPIEPRERRESGIRVYDSELGVDLEDFGTPEVRFLVPTVESTITNGVAPPRLTLPIITRAGSHQVVLGPIDDLVLQVIDAGRVDDVPEVEGSWFVTVTDPGNGRTLYRAGATALPPGIVRVPRQVFDGQEAESLLVALDSQYRVATTAGGGAYGATLTVAARLVWRVVPTGP